MNPTIAELEAILNSEDDTPVTINSDGTIGPPTVAPAIKYREALAVAMMECGLATGHGDTFEDLICEMKGGVERISALVYVPGQWRCAKCNFRLSQMNLYVADGSVGPRDDAGDKCPNCHGPLWRVSAMDERNEAFKTANDMFDEVERLRKLVPEAQRYPEQRPPDAS